MPQTASRSRSAAVCTLALVLAGGCASPGPPRPPSLRLPEPVTDLSARRIGDGVELRFTAPSRSTDKLPLRAARLNGVLCRAVEHGPCVAVAGFASDTATATAGAQGGHNVVTWRDPLPAPLLSGSIRPLSYRVEFFNDAGHSAGKSEAAYTAAGQPPSAVENLHAEGSRLGIVLRWSPAPEQTAGAVLLQREDLAPKTRPAARAASSAAAAGSEHAAAKRHGGSQPQSRKPARPAKAGTDTAGNIVWLEADATGHAAAGLATPTTAVSQGSETLDTNALPIVPYRYTAFRRVTATLGGRSIEVRSAPSAPVDFTLQEIYPPPAPTGLTAAGYTTTTGPAAPAGEGFSVDLIWQPVDGAGLIASLAGYNIYRETIPAQGAAGGSGGRNKERLNTEPVALPSFHDSSARPAEAYRYFVTAVDSKRNESSATTTVLQPSQSP